MPDRWERAAERVGAAQGARTPDHVGRRRERRTARDVGTAPDGSIATPPGTSIEVRPRCTTSVPGRSPDAESFLHAGQVADILHVSPKTIARWAKDGRLPFQRTLGGHRRYPEQAIRQLAASLAQGVRAS